MSKDKTIFLSHIHEEKNLAILFKNALEKEFSGFVDVFVSSDERSNPAGTNFLKRIEDELISCRGAMYLLSPHSVQSNWINFELGAVWIRKIISSKNNEPEIPVLPVCHSGMTIDALPQPICNLNAIHANKSSDLERAFRSIQTAVGGKGVFRTDFDVLAQKVIAFERDYTLGVHVKSLFKIIGATKQEIQNVIQHCESLPPRELTVSINIVNLSTDKIQRITEYEQNHLKGKIQLTTAGAGMQIIEQHGQQVARNGANASIFIDISLILEFKELLLST